MKFKLVDNLNEQKGVPKYKTYTNGTDEIKLLRDEIPPEGYEEKKKIPWNKGLKADTDERVKANADKCHQKRKENGTYNAWNKNLTAETDERVAYNSQQTKKGVMNKYGVENISQYLSKQPDYKVWNDGLTKETNSSIKAISDKNKGKIPWNKNLTAEEDDRIYKAPRDEKTKEKIRQSHLTPEVQYKRFKTMEQNGTLGHNQDTKAELEYLEELLTKYDSSDIKHPYMDKDRYPFKCDFYIVSEDLFIEVHGNWTHGGKPFDPNDSECIKQLEQWKEKAKTSNYYKNAIYQWTDLDVRKLQVAEKNNLNFKVVYYKYKNKK